MNKVAIVYWSGTGNTETMANAIATGVKNKGAAVETMTSAEFTSAKVSAFDTFAFGCPSMGAEVLEETEFQPMWDEVKDALSGRTVLLFGSYGWGSGEWMQSWQNDCDDSNINVMEAIICNETPDEDAQATCTAAGEKLAG